MRIGLVSDSHNNHTNVRTALARFSESGIAVVLHAGDITQPNTLELLSGYDVWAARGNMDHNRELEGTADRLFGAGRFRAVHHLTLDGVTIGLTHGDSPNALQALLSGGYDYVIVGHTHAREDRQVGSTRVINPGALGNTRWQPASFAILDTQSGELRWFVL